MATVKKRSTLPIYLVAAVWLIYAMFFELYALSHYITASIISVAVFIIAHGIWPTKVFELPDPKPAQAEAPPREKTETELKVEGLIKERDRAISEMRRLNDSIEDEDISSQIDKLEQTTAKIIDHVVDYPDKHTHIRKFLNYYLPTTIKLLNTYDRMGSVGGTGENIDGTMKKIEDMLATVIVSFEKQLDALFTNEAMDISSDITVMENLLVQEGLSGAEQF